MIGIPIYKPTYILYIVHNRFTRIKIRLLVNGGVGFIIFGLRGKASDGFSTPSTSSPAVVTPGLIAIWIRL